MRVPFLPAKPCVLSLLSPSAALVAPFCSLSFCPIRRAFPRSSRASRFHRCALSFPMHPHYARRLVIFQFPSLALPLSLCSFLDTVERLNATTSPLCGSCLSFLLLFSFPLIFLSPPRGLIRRNGMMRDATKEKNIDAVFGFRELFCRVTRIHTGYSLE